MIDLLKTYVGSFAVRMASLWWSVMNKEAVHDELH